MSEIMKQCGEYKLWHIPSNCHPETCCCSNHYTWEVSTKTTSVRFPTYDEALKYFYAESSR